MFILLKQLMRTVVYCLLWDLVMFKNEEYCAFYDSTSNNVNRGSSNGVLSVLTINQYIDCLNIRAE